MNKTIKRSWCKALRSGKYKQGRYRLWYREYDTHCCLGVLCRSQGMRGTKSITNCQRFDGLASALSSKLLKKFGLTERNQQTLIMCNDDRQWSFSKIADWIEKHL